MPTNLNLSSKFKKQLPHSDEVSARYPTKRASNFNRVIAISSLNFFLPAVLPDSITIDKTHR